MEEVDVEYCLPGDEGEDLPTFKADQAVKHLRTSARHLPLSEKRRELRRGSAQVAVSLVEGVEKQLNLLKFVMNRSGSRQTPNLSLVFSRLGHCL